MDSTDVVASALDTLFSKIEAWSSYLLIVAGLGTLTMAVLQAIKDLTPVRRIFHRAQMRNWLEDHASPAAFKESVKPAGSQVRRFLSRARQRISETLGTLARLALRRKIGETAENAERELLKLTADGDSRAFYDLELEKLCGQWGAAVQILIDSPELGLALFNCMAMRAQPTDREALTNTERVAHLQPPPLEGIRSPEDREKRQEEHQKLLDARTRVAHQLQRAIDSFQIKTGYRWKWRLQMLSYLVSTLFAAVAVHFYGKHIALASYPRVVVSVALAGFLAPVARDLLAAVGKLRS